MTLDERLERLTERHEALTQSVELLLKAQTATEGRVAQLIDVYTRLGNIVISHEDRISRLEDEQK
jgi:hypothetical protein